MVVAYILMVGVPILALLGILDVGRGITAPPSIGGDWNLEFDAASICASGLAKVRQPALNISQSGTEALVTVNDGRAAAFPVTIDGNTLRSQTVTATITGKPGQRVLDGKLDIAGCGPVAFHAVRRPPAKKGGE